MIYRDVHAARFLARPNRFIAHAELDGREVVAHVKNTGRCKELLIPGSTVYLEYAPKPGRKTDYSLIAVDKGGKLINMDSQAPNRIIGEALRSGWLPEGLTGTAESVKAESTFGDSRLDFSFQAARQTVYMEVKGVTLEEEGATFFPDAPTERGIKHLYELAGIRERGMSAWAVFVIQMEQVDSFAPNDRTHPAFGDALRQAAAAGVGIAAYACKVKPDAITLGARVPVLL